MAVLADLRDAIAMMLELEEVGAHVLAAARRHANDALRSDWCARQDTRSYRDVAFTWNARAP